MPERRLSKHGGYRMRHKITKFDQGLFLSGGEELIPPGFNRRYRGISAQNFNSVRSRYGSTELYTLSPHSIDYFNGKYYSGHGTQLYENSALILSGLNGNRLTFAAMPPTAGAADQLFFAGGGSLYKVSTAGTVTNWGIAPPSDLPTPTASGVAGNLGNGDYQYKTTFLNSTTGTRSNPLVTVESALKLLLHFENNVTDATGNHIPVNVNGCTFDNAIFKFGAWSIDMDGVNQHVTVPSSQDWVMGSEDFTIHAWVYFDAASSAIWQYWGDADNYVRLYDTAGLLRFEVKIAGSLVLVMQAPSGVGLATWAHIAVVRAGNIWKLHVDGIRKVSILSTVTWPDFSTVNGTLYIGRILGTYNDYLTGKLDEFAWYKGQALWDAGDFTPPTSATTVSGRVTTPNQSVNLTNIPVSADSQVDYTEIWRTLVNGSVYFKLTSVANGTTTYTDNIADANLEPLELPTDNIKPYEWFDDCVGLFNASTFWLTRSQVGERGRLYYSPIGRVEAVAGFINVTNDSEGLQKIVRWGGMLVVFSKSKAFQILGTNPYYTRELSGIPGTITPFTVVSTPMGIIWQSQDGVRIFEGAAQSTLLAYDQIQPIFRGLSVAGLTPFSGVTATYARGEYILSDAFQTLALGLQKQLWRDLGVGCNCLKYIPELDVIAATEYSRLMKLEDAGTIGDGANAISFLLDPPALQSDIPMVIERVLIDANTGGGTVTAGLLYDGATVSLGNLSTSTSRVWTIFTPSPRCCNKIQVQINGTLTAPVEIFGVYVDLAPLVVDLKSTAGVFQIPGRLSTDKQSLTFEPEIQNTPEIGQIWSFDRLFYDLNLNSNSIVIKFNTVGGAEEIAATVNEGTRVYDEVALNKLGRFEHLTIEGNFNLPASGPIGLRKLSISARPVLLDLIVDGDVIQVPGRLQNNNQTLVFDFTQTTFLSPANIIVFDRLFYDIISNNNSIIFSLALIGQTALGLGNLNLTARQFGELNITRAGLFENLTLLGNFNGNCAIQKLELVGRRNKTI